MSNIDVNKLQGNERELMEWLLQAHPTLHNGDAVINADEANKLINRNPDKKIDLNDWKIFATPELPLSQRNFAIIANILKPALQQHQLKLDLPTPSKFQAGLSGVLPKVEQGDSLYNKARHFCDKPSQFCQSLQTMSKADLHLHFGGNASPRLLYQMALNRVGAGALDPDKWGGRLNWDSEPSYTDYTNFQKATLDNVIRKAKVGTTSHKIAEANFVPPSSIIAKGQEIARVLAATVDPQEKSKLEMEQEKNFEIFQQLALYTPLGEKTNLGEFLNIYRFCAVLVETSSSPEVLTSAFADAMDQLTSQGVHYVEMRLGAPKLDLVKKLYPDLSDEAAIAKQSEILFSAVVHAIQETNQKLITAGKDPVDIRLIYTLSKSASRSPENLLQTKALLKLLQARPDLTHYIVGIDGSSKEPGELPKFYLEHLSLIKNYNQSVPQEKRLGITWHQGEDFSDTSLFDAIRRVDVMVDLGINRLGHGLVVGLNPLQFRGQKFEMLLDEYESYLRYETSFPITMTPIDWSTFIPGAFNNLQQELDRVVKLKQDGVTKISGTYPERGMPLQLFSNAMRERQAALIEKIKRNIISIEINPTSNLYMALPSGNIQDHPLPYLLQQGVNVTINTDDAGIFDTHLNREWILATLLAHTPITKVHAWIQEGFAQSFPVKVRGESLVYLR